MKQIQLVPDIWDDQRFPTSKGLVISALAASVIRQSSYRPMLSLVPKKLSRGLREFNSAFTGDYDFVTSCQKLIKMVHEVINECPTIVGWSLDLDALARNVAYAVTLEEKYKALHFQKGVSYDW